MRPAKSSAASCAMDRLYPWWSAGDDVLQAESGTTSLARTMAGHRGMELYKVSRQMAQGWVCHCEPRLAMIVR